MRTALVALHVDAAAAWRERRLGYWGVLIVSEFDQLQGLVADLALVAAEIAEDCPTVRTTLHRPRARGSFGVSCHLAHPHEPDLVELEIVAEGGELAADIVWGHPSGCVECSWTETRQPLTAENVERLRRDLPGLVSALRIAVERASPPV